MVDLGKYQFMPGSLMSTGLIMEDPDVTLGEKAVCAIVYCCWDDGIDMNYLCDCLNINSTQACTYVMSLIDRGYARFNGDIIEVTDEKGEFDE